jgi:hypothetical protein
MSQACTVTAGLNLDSQADVLHTLGDGPGESCLRCRYMHDVRMESFAA